MRKIKYFMAIFAILLVLTGCKKDIDYPIRYDVKNGATSLDPQFAVDKIEELIIENTYEGLFRLLNDGTVVKTSCKDYAVSNDNKIYTFTLKDNLKWDDGKNVTAADFEFAFKRIFNPNYPSPYAERYLNIKNASKILSGQLGKDKLGVYAKDDKILVIELEKPDTTLPRLLSHFSSMPVNKEHFISSKGQYAMNLENSFSNGPFYVKTWDNDKYILLRKNDYYRNKNNIKILGVNIHINREQDGFTLLDKGDADVFTATLDQIQSNKEIPFTYEGFDNKVYSIVFNQQDEFFKNEHITKALKLAINKNDIKKLLEEDMMIVNSVVPPMAQVNGEKYNKTNPITNTYNQIKAREELNLGLSELEITDIPKKTIIMEKDSKLDDMFGYIFQMWQKELSVFFEVQILEQNEFNARIRKGNYDCAVTYMTTQSSDVYDTLEQFTKNSLGNIINYNDDSYDELISNAKNSVNTNKAIQYYKKCEENVVGKGRIIPVYIQTKYLVVAPNIFGFEYYPYADIAYFANIYRKK